MLEAMLPQVLQVGAGWQMLLDQLAGHRREQDLSSVSGTHDAGGMMYIHPDVAVCSQHRFARMQANAYPHRCVIRPHMICEGSLYLYSCRDGIGGTSKGNKEGISLGVNFVAVILCEYLSQQVPAVSQHPSLALTQRLQEARRAFDIGEEQRHGASR